MGSLGECGGVVDGEVNGVCERGVSRMGYAAFPMFHSGIDSGRDGISRLHERTRRMAFLRRMIRGMAMRARDCL